MAVAIRHCLILQSEKGPVLGLITLSCKSLGVAWSCSCEKGLDSLMRRCSFRVSTSLHKFLWTFVFFLPERGLSKRFLCCKSLIHI